MVIARVAMVDQCGASEETCNEVISGAGSFSMVCEILWDSNQVSWPIRRSIRFAVETVRVAMETLCCRLELLRAGLA
jgi:hypothetical protein